MAWIKKKWKILFIFMVMACFAAIAQSPVTSQCCNSISRLFAPQPVAVQRPVYVRPAPVIVQRPIVAQPVRVYYPPQSVQVYSQPIPVQTYYPPQPVTNSCCAVQPASQIVAQTEMQEHEVTQYETVWDEETRYRERTVSRIVPETSVRTEKYLVSKPVWDTIEKDTSYDIVRYVTETSEREEIQTVSKPVTQIQEREIVETVSRPVTTTVMQQKEYTVNKPCTTMQVQTQDQGQYVTQYTPLPQKKYTRLTWQRMEEYVDPATGVTRTRLPGLYWTELTGPQNYKENKVWQSRYVQTEVPITTYIPEKVVENVPVEVTTYQKEEIVRKEQVPVTSMVQEQQVKKIPVTTYKPVREHIVQKTPVRVYRLQTEEQVREIPVTTYKTVTEVIQEPYTVKVPRTVEKKVKVMRPVTVYKQIQETVTSSNGTSDTNGNMISSTSVTSTKETTVPVTSGDSNTKDSTLPGPEDSKPTLNGTPVSKLTNMPAIPQKDDSTEISVARPLSTTDTTSSIKENSVIHTDTTPESANDTINSSNHDNDTVHPNPIPNSAGLFKMVTPPNNMGDVNKVNTYDTTSKGLNDMAPTLPRMSSNDSNDSKVPQDSTKTTNNDIKNNVTIKDSAPIKDSTITDPTPNTPQKGENIDPVHQPETDPAAQKPVITQTVQRPVTDSPQNNTTEKQSEQQSQPQPKPQNTNNNTENNSPLSPPIVAPTEIMKTN